MFTWLRTWITILELARILAGESPTCNLPTKVALSYVSERNTVWYARDKPTGLDLAVALSYRSYPDYSLGGYYALGPGDPERLSQLGTTLGDPLVTFTCEVTTITIYPS